MATPLNGPPAARVSRTGLGTADAEALMVAKMVAMVAYCMTGS